MPYPYNDLRAVGAVGDGIHDDTAATQRGAALPGWTQASAGRFKLTDTVYVPAQEGTWFGGVGPSTVFVWAGLPDRPMFVWEDARTCRGGSFKIFTSATSYPLLLGIQVLTTATPQGVSNHNMLDWVLIEGTNGGIDTGIWIGGPGHRDTNNDFMHLEHCDVRNCASYSYRVSGFQAYQTQLRSCLSSGTGTTRAALCLDSGQVRWSGGGGYGHSAFVELHEGGGAHPCVLEYIRSEKDGMFVDAHDSARTLEISHCSWAAGAVDLPTPDTERWPDGIINSAHNIMDLGNCNTTIRHSVFGDGSETHIRDWHIRAWSTTFIFENNDLYTGDPDNQAGTLFPIQPPSRAHGNRVVTEGQAGGGFLPERWPGWIDENHLQIGVQRLYRTRNLTPLTITTFNATYGVPLPPYTEITIVIEDPNTTFAPGGNLRLPNNAPFTPVAGAVTRWLWDGTHWLLSSYSP